MMEALWIGILGMSGDQDKGTWKSRGSWLFFPNYGGSCRISLQSNSRRKGNCPCIDGVLTKNHMFHCSVWICPETAYAPQPIGLENNCKQLLKWPWIGEFPILWTNRPSHLPLFHSWLFLFPLSRRCLLLTFLSMYPRVIKRGYGKSSIYSSFSQL